MNAERRWDMYLGIFVVGLIANFIWAAIFDPWIIPIGVATGALTWFLAGKFGNPLDNLNRWVLRRISRRNFRSH